MKVIFGMNPNCSALWAALTILLFATPPLGLIIGLVNAYLLKKKFKNMKLLEEEVLKKAEEVRILKKLVWFLIISVLIIISLVIINLKNELLISNNFWLSISLIIRGMINFFRTSMGSMFLIGIYLMIVILFCRFIGKRILFSKYPRLIYLVMPLMAFLAAIILNTIILFIIFGGE